MARAKTIRVFFAIDEDPKRIGLSTNRNDQNANSSETMHARPNEIFPASGKSMIIKTNNGQCQR